MATDISYIDGGLFTTFYPESEAGHTAWRELAQQTDGTGKVLSAHAELAIAALRKAGYRVTAMAPADGDDSSVDALLAELSD